MSVASEILVAAERASVEILRLQVENQTLRERIDELTTSPTPPVVVAPVRVITQNLARWLPKRLRNHKKILRALMPECDVLLLQESNKTNLAAIKGKLDASDAWGLFHLTENDGTAASAVLYRRSLGVVTGWGLAPLIPWTAGIMMEARHITWVRIQLTGDTRETVFASLHNAPNRPPLNKGWPIAETNLAAFVADCEAKGYRYVLAGDFNQPFPEPAIAEGLKVRRRGVGIDGFLTSRDFDVPDAEELPKNASDHPPVRIVAEVKP